MSVTLDQIRQAAENDLATFIKLVSPEQVLGQCHEDVCNWWTRGGSKSHQLLLFPRDHGKSRLVAYRVAWELTKDSYVTDTVHLSHCKPCREATRVYQGYPNLGDL